jgi:hypothetical protein
MNKFWMVWNPLRSQPTHKHHSFESAKTEAERLARANPNEEFIVLESVGSCRKNDVSWTNHEIVELPF